MIVWLAVVVPIVAVVVLWWQFHHKLTWWEVLILVGTPIILVALSKLIIEATQVHDTEFWGGHVAKSEYYEDWNERVSCRHPKYRTVTRTDSKGNTHTEQVFDGYEHLYDVDYHPPYWQVIDSNGFSVGIDQQLFETLAKRWNSRKFVDLHRNYHTDDGDKYEAHWDVRPETIEAVTTSHSYSNRVQASKSVFNFKEIDPKIHELFEYPKIAGYYGQRVILGNGGATHIEAEKKLEYYNAILGPKKEARMYILVFKDKPLEAALDQEAYWKGSNKNEFVTCVGVDSKYEVKWAYCISWTEVEELKVRARNFLVEQKTLDLAGYVDWLGKEVEAKFVRFNWHKFDYLTVEPPGWAVALVFILTILINAGVALWAVVNIHEPDRAYMASVDNRGRLFVESVRNKFKSWKEKWRKP